MTVSVIMITYGHEKYIKQAIEGVIMQKTNFPFELLIANDCSPDNTDAIVKNTINNLSHKEHIHYFRHEKNIGMQNNFLFLYDRAKGNYIALCEGDDYWIDEYKLQKQVDFLENNKECSFSFHLAYKMLNDLPVNHLTEIYPVGINKKILSKREYLRLSTTATCSLVFRNIKLDSIRKMLHSQADFILYCTLLEVGNAGFINEVMAVYRKHERGVSFFNWTEPYMSNRIDELFIEREYFEDKEIKKEINRKIMEMIFSYLNHYSTASSEDKLKRYKDELKKNAMNVFLFKVERKVENIKEKMFNRLKIITSN